MENDKLNQNRQRRVSARAETKNPVYQTQKITTEMKLKEKGKSV